MASFFTFSQPLDIDVHLEGEDERKIVEVKGEKDRKESAPIYLDGESVKGQAIVRLRDNKVVKHDGIKVEFVGSIGVLSPSPPPLHFTHDRTELFYDRGNHYEFLSLQQELASPGELRSAQTYDFEFKNVEKQYESYNGINVKLRCAPHPANTRRKLICAQLLYPHHPHKADGRRRQREGAMGTLLPHAARLEQRHQDGGRHRGLLAHRVRIQQIQVRLFPSLPVHLHDGPHRYHLKDVIVGKIYFLLVRIKIKHMELSIIRRETTGAGVLSVDSLRTEHPSEPAHSTKSVQRERDDHQIRDHGRRTSER